MIRRLINLLTALSMLLCVAVAALWVRKYLASDWVSRETLTADREFTYITEWTADTPRGSVRLTWRHTRLRQSPAGQAQMYGVWRREPHEPIGLTRESSQPASVLDRLGFDWADVQYGGVGGGSVAMWTVAFPLWAPAALFAVLSSAFLCERVRRRRWTRGGVCPSCGYDLRATTDRCPECGATEGSA